MHAAEAISEGCSCESNASKKHKNIHKGAHSQIKVQVDSLQSHQEWTHLSMASSENQNEL